MTEGFDLLTMGRISVDIYPNDVGVDLEDVKTFGKYVGGSPTNVAIAAARYGDRSAVITKTGADPFGVYLHRELRRYGVDDRYVSEDSSMPTPVTFCAIKPPEDFPLYFYRTPTAPDLQITDADLDTDAIRTARIFWLTVTGLCQEPSRSAHLSALRARGKGEKADSRFTVLDLDYRDMFWTSRDEAHEQIARVLPYATVAIGNRTECSVAVGAAAPEELAGRLLDSGVGIAVVKQGADGVLAKTRDETVMSPAIPVETVNGLGAGDAFGGAFCHGLLSGWSLQRTLDFANGAGAYVASQISCSEAMPDEKTVDALLDAHGLLREGPR